MSEGDSGWIRLYRDLLNKPIWTVSTTEQKVIMITLLLMANHEEKEWEWKGKKFKCKKGQFITSLDRIVEKTGKCVTIQNVRTALVRFEKYEFLTNESTKTGRLITICNWDYYQQVKDIPIIDANKDLTKSQQRPNKELTPNKNDKNYKNDNNTIKEKEKEKEKSTRFVPPTIDEVRNYCLERNNNVDPEKFINFYESKGWMVGKNKMKDWKASIRTWEKGDNGKKVKPISPTTYYKNSNLENDDRW